MEEEDKEKIFSSNRTVLCTRAKTRRIEARATLSGESSQGSLDAPQGLSVTRPFPRLPRHSKPPETASSTASTSRPVSRRPTRRRIATRSAYSSRKLTPTRELCGDGNLALLPRLMGAKQRSKTSI